MQHVGLLPLRRRAVCLPPARRRGRRPLRSWRRSEVAESIACTSTTASTGPNNLESSFVRGTYDDEARDGGEGTSGTIDGGAAQSMDGRMSDVIDGGAPLSVDEQMSDMGAGGSGGGALQGAIRKKKMRKTKHTKSGWTRSDEAKARRKGGDAE